MLKIYRFKFTHYKHQHTYFFPLPPLNISSSFTYMLGHEADVFASADDITSSKKNERSAI